MQLAEHRLGPVARREGYHNVEAMLASLWSRPVASLGWGVIEALLNGETWFRRDRAAFEVLEREPRRRADLRRNVRHFHDGLIAAGFDLGPSNSPIASIRCPDQETAIRFWNMLLAAGVYVNLALGPATPGGRPLLRTSVCAEHTPEQIEQALAAIRTVEAVVGVNGLAKFSAAAD